MRKGTRRYIKSILPPEIHLPNKNEAKLLRKLKKQTGMTEEEIRSHKKYRILLSQAQKNVRKHTEQEKMFLAILKNITKKLKLSKEHPLVLKEIGTEIAEKQKGVMYFMSSRYSGLPTSPSKLIEYMRALDNKNKEHDNNRQNKTK
ncbi:MAG: hypothetical protein HC836_49650 [Richelia sp. RM2_1_2]|nr:hypothetical protein [Richelia sp. RM2_1_2]